ncbi:DUF4433 domain-containing protein [Halosquirtibacter laminarini]|uniref:DUF4433 domain-containing protein n=1 Tax=Halosquirtibacter laminarini TaxID=3374600 RepID=A0AC61NJP6_9BACT|nr:DUF4433 domain-containing protein [Prolixibacteraceae bacterium]
MNEKQNTQFIRNNEFVLTQIEEVQNLIKEAIASESYRSLDSIKEIYNTLFLSEDIREHVTYKLSTVGNSSMALGRIDMNAANARHHITLKLNPSLYEINQQYNNLYEDLVHLFKYLFSALENLTVYQNDRKILKYQKLLHGASEYLHDLIVNHTQVNDNQKRWNKVLQEREAWELSKLKEGKIERQDASDLYEILQSNGIEKLYHFTERENVKSIMDHGGLYARELLHRNNINIKNPGGDTLSYELDKMKSSEHYVRLSFCKRHPMLEEMIKKGRIQDPVILEIDVSVLKRIGSKICDQNASRRDAVIRYELETFRSLRYDLFQKTYSGLSYEEKDAYQAEVLIWEKVPINYISNLNHIG